MLLWSYFSVVLTDPGGVPPNWRAVMDEEIGETDSLVGAEYNGVALASNQLSDLDNQRVRFCRKCNQFKPPRCHHCSVCEFFEVIFYVSVQFSFRIVVVSLEKG